MGLPIIRLGKREFLIILLLVALAATSLFFILPLIEGEKEIQIEDKCGRFVNLESHTIPDEESCNSRCRAQCMSTDMELKKADFRMAQGACNECVCHCR